jgi:replicative DNA helicase Mcm
MALSTQEQIEKFQEFLETYHEKDLHNLVLKGLNSLTINFSDLAEFNHELAEQTLDDPENLLKAAEISIKGFDFMPDQTFRVRLSNLPKTQTIKIRNIRKDHIDKLIAMEGVVRTSSDVRPQVISAKFECPSCGNNITIAQLEASFREPTRCSCGRRGKFRLIHKDLVDTQRLVIEESSESLEGGEQPKRLPIFLREDLVEPTMERRTTPGTKVMVSVVVKEIPIPSKTGGTSTRYDLAGEANHIEPIEETFEDIIITPEDEETIKTLAKDPGIYEKFVASMAPSIFGHEDIKGALVLQLMGGLPKEKPDGTSIRGDMHILLVGDPGASKSSLLNFISKAAPKARYTSGKGVSSAGITASVVRDEFLRGWALEAGALVLANNGFLALDEMDKMSVEDTSALHEAMEHQKITISKANIQATLRAKTTILAAANPKFGRFDPYQPIAAQIDLPPALINRFDLIFPVRDLPNKEKDTKIAEHILNLQQDVSRITSPIPAELLKKYIAYVRQSVFPKLTQSAIEEIKDFYVNLRNSGSTGDDAVKPIPISARQLEALVRLAEAAARVRLSDQVTRKDAKKAISVLKYCLMQVGFDYETGQIDIDRISTGITASKRSKIVAIREIISEMEASGKKTIPLEDIIAEASEKGITEDQVEEVIKMLKTDGTIFEPKSGFISKI